MSETQFNYLVSMITSLNNKVDGIINHMTTIEQRLSALENAGRTFYSPSTMVPTTPSFVPGPRHGVAGMAPTGTMVLPSHNLHNLPNHGFGTGSQKNASYLPFAIAKIVQLSHGKHPEDDRQCRQCGEPFHSVSCFRNDHYRWCRVHHRPIMPPHLNCGVNYHGCIMVNWEQHPDWETIVAMSKPSMDTKTPGLNQALFPRDLYPSKYDNHGNFKG